MFVDWPLAKRITTQLEEKNENTGKKSKKPKKGSTNKKSVSIVPSTKQLPTLPENLPAKQVAQHFDELYQLLEADEQLAGISTRAFSFISGNVEHSFF